MSMCSIVEEERGNAWLLGRLSQLGVRLPAFTDQCRCCLRSTCNKFTCKS